MFRSGVVAAPPLCWIARLERHLCKGCRTDRRHFIRTGALGVAAAGLARPGGLLAQVAPLFDPIGPILPVRAISDRIFRITVCLRPFRATGPRLDVEQVGRKLVVHNYGHGGSGWSLSWGSAMVAVGKATANGPKEIAVIGAGALGLTAAITAQSAGRSLRGTAVRSGREAMPAIPPGWTA